MSESETAMVLWECDQCAYREWRPADHEPWLCVVCGYERWGSVAVAADPEESDEAPELGESRRE